ncbi:hypothetical protein OIE69_44405 (plasmid) [Actinacidiphila glaucinigra]|uniref:hypothetical protein n=1 Tax=Actinacidiphila glaucinigra TaxID=235986 RepID=UPI002DDC40AF|nr:hypothetical protein [Actinacidiphila glaucinigra]WSD65764.1 hypothetical protein OIE69_43445 [Actinacidiphila glaucinigra]WSD65948.1 hypothetical protein OIE69_44405 [Actinacidiphila glaucinigra]
MGDVIVAFFTDGPGERHAEYEEEPFTADPHALGDCPCQGCEVCDERNELALDGSLDAAGLAGLTQNDARYVCLAPSQPDADCTVVFRNTPVAVIPAAQLAGDRG